MSGLMNKVKDALGGDKHNTNTSTTGLENEHGTQSGVHDTPIEGSVAHGSSLSPTNPGVLHSTKPGIHGERDSGVSGSGYDDTTTTTRDTGLGGDSGMNAGPQFTGSRDRDAGLVQSGVDSTRRDGAGMSGGSRYDGTRDTGLSGIGTGSRYDDSRDTGLSGTGTGSRYDDTRDTGLSGTGTGSRYDDTRDTGLGGDSGRSAGSQFTGTGERDAGLVQSGVDSTRREGRGGMTGSSGYDDNTRDTGLTGTGTSSGYDNNTRDLPGSTGTGTGYDERTRGTGTGYGSGMTGFDSDRGSSGMTGGGDTATRSSGLAGQAERYVGGSERHHRGDGHPEDIVHPGPHETMTAKALDPHLNE